MCRLWFSSGCSFSSSEISSLRSDLDRLLLAGGPDHQQLISRDLITAYHSRLAIQGLSKTSNQPYIGSNSSILVFNGEILNWRSLLHNSGCRYQLISNLIRNFYPIFLILVLYRILFKTFVDSFRLFTLIQVKEFFLHPERYLWC